MKTHALNFTAVVLGLALTGCETPEGTPNRAGSGALIGAGSGAAIGALAGGRHAGGAAIIGGAIGAITGGLIGSSLDEQERARLRAQAPQTYTRIDQGQPLQVADVTAMSKAGIKDELIISQIRNSHSVYHLSASEIIELRDAGVSQKVIEYMINTPSTSGSASTVTTAPQVQTVYVEQAPPSPQVETIFVAPGPGYVWIAGEWEWRGRWVWVGGHWIYPPYPGAVWVSTVWVRGPNGYRCHHGHWR